MGDIAFDSVNNRYLVVFERVDNQDQFDIYGQIVNCDGTPYGPPFPICAAAYNQQHPRVAYDRLNQRYLVVWYDQRNTFLSTSAGDIYGRLVNGNGLLSGDEIAISQANNEQLYPDVAYSPSSQRYLVSWMDRRDEENASGDVYGQMIDQNGTLQSGDFIISSGSGGTQFFPAVHSAIAYDNTLDRFFVVWIDWRNALDTGLEVRGQLVSALGATIGSNTLVSHTNINPDSLSIAYNPDNQMFLIVWADSSNFTTTKHDIFGAVGEYRWNTEWFPFPSFR